MKNVIVAIIIIFLILGFLESVRFGFPNSRTPEATKFYTTYGHHVLYDENVECYNSHDCFRVTKLGYDISRDDECEYCRRKWKWHYNKD